MYIGFYSDTWALNNMTDYLARIVQPQLQAVKGVQSAQLVGGKVYAMRVWLEPEKLAEYKISAVDVREALRNNNVLSALGETKGKILVEMLSADTGLNTVAQFKNMVIQSKDGIMIRLADVAKVELGVEDYDSIVKLDGHEAVFIGISLTPSADLLAVIDNIKQVLPPIQARLPSGLKGEIVYDASLYVHASIQSVLYALTEALLIVGCIIFIFLGSLRSTIIPLVVVPLSIIGAFLFMFLSGYSINLLTLLALVIAVGLVVDDAILVVENIERYVNEGQSIFQACLLGVRELTSPIIAITVVLIAVYLPIGFTKGLTNALFTEFAYTLAGTITISALIALTLSPLMCLTVLKPSPDKKDTKHSFATQVNDIYAKLKQRYEKMLHYSLNNTPVIVVFAVIIISSNYFLFKTSPTSLAPQEDQGIIVVQIQTPSNSSLDVAEDYVTQAYNIVKKFPEVKHVFEIGQPGGAMLGLVLKPWSQRKLTTNQLQPIIQADLSSITGAQVGVFQPPSLPGGGGGAPIQLIITSTDDFNKLNTVANEFIKKFQATGLFTYLVSDLHIDKLQTNVIFNRLKAAQLGYTMESLGNILGAELSGAFVNYFDYAGQPYKVIPQIIRTQNLNSEQLLNYYLTTPSGISIPLSTIATLKKEVIPESLNHFQQSNAVTISAVTIPSIPMGKALNVLTQISKQLPLGYTTHYGAQSRQFLHEKSSLLITFFFALLIIYFSLAILFNSFRDPWVVLICVPMSICGAMIVVNMNVGGLTLNIYSEIGLVTLMGLISKHGILIIQFANKLQQEGINKKQAIQMAAAIRLRPILMTTVAIVLGVFPLIMASGAGSASRFDIGIVIASGMTVGTIFNLFVVPTMYLLIAKDAHKKIQD
jgi:multidrug efflux pump